MEFLSNKVTPWSDFVVDQHWSWLESVLMPVVPASTLLSFQEDPRFEQYLDQPSGYWDVFGILHKYSLPNFQVQDKIVDIYRAILQDFHPLSFNFCRDIPTLK